MEVLIKYRNDRKKEGASQGELMGLDGRINALLSSGAKEGTALDLEILVYRRQLAATDEYRAIGWDFLARLDKHIYHVLGSKPARIGDVKVCSIGSIKKEIPVSVDFNNETVGDLTIKAAVALGLNPNMTKLIFAGKHLEHLDMPLSSVHFQPDSTVFACQRLGCNGRCCEMGYSMLCDALLRDTHSLFKSMDPEKLHELFLVVCNARAQIEQPQIEQPQIEQPQIEQPQIKKSVWATEPVFKSDVVMCRVIGSEPKNRSEKFAVERLCKLLSEDPFTKGSDAKKICWAEVMCKLTPTAATTSTAATAATATTSTVVPSEATPIIDESDLYG